MALRLAVLLEAYAARCAEVVCGNAHVPHPSETELIQRDTTLPELPRYPEDLDGWRAIDAILTGRCLMFRNKLRSSQGIIDGMIAHDRGILHSRFSGLAAEHGLEAWQLAAALRHRHGIETADPLWDYAKQLKRMLEETQKTHGPEKRD
ncbi:hypothetical protein [Microvirga sp. VF16]|uniref:hypothetical protein n=1 Tax=Microvirga sp. VF16 TaxID=2807101 RepID=UPI00193EBF86|nr:hypothetical protein [Microvirga sp. VF16]QRM35229.1 hypothetical protein JO965_40350 [Microvirga sp. VF16]